MKDNKMLLAGAIALIVVAIGFVIGSMVHTSSNKTDTGKPPSLPPQAREEMMRQQRGAH